MLCVFFPLFKSLYDGLEISYNSFPKAPSPSFHHLQDATPLSIPFENAVKALSSHDAVKALGSNDAVKALGAHAETVATAVKSLKK